MHQEKSGNANNKVLLIIAAVFVLAICVFVVISVVNTVLRDNPQSSQSGGGATSATVDAAAEGEKYKNTVALTFGDFSITAVELNYYYVELVNKFASDYNYYLSYFMDTSKPLNEQYFDEESGMTWADYFLDAAKENLKSTYLLAELATQQGMTLSESDLEYLDSIRENIEYYATYYQYSDVNSYLVDFFGYGSDIDSYIAYCHRSLLADTYYNHYADSLIYNDEALRAYEAGKTEQYNSYSYAVYYLSAEKFLTGGTEDGEGNITYTDEEKQAAIQAVTDTATSLDGRNCADMEAFEAMILGLEVNASLDSVSITQKTDLLYSKIDETYREWLASADRQVGDVTVFAKTTTNSSTEEETVTGYYILWFAGINDNTFFLKDVRHVLVMFENENGKTYADGVYTFTDEQKQAAKDAAEELLNAWVSTGATEDAFAEMANKQSDDGDGTTGGLYVNIYPGQMVTNFENWCYDESRQPGEYGLVETEFGWHIMYFVGNSSTYRDYMIAYEMRSQDLNDWHNALLESAEITEVCLDYCPLGMTIYG